MANEADIQRGAPGGAGGYRTLLAAHLAATALVLLEFTLLQALAIGITTAIHTALAPALDAGAPLKFAEWERIFRVISPTITVSGGAGIVLSSIIYARQAQKAQNEAAAAQAQAAAAWAQANAAREEAIAERERILAEREQERGQAFAERERILAEREQEREQAFAARQQEREQIFAAREQEQEQAFAAREQEREQAFAAREQAIRLAEENAALRLELARATERLTQLENGGSNGQA